MKRQLLFSLLLAPLCAYAATVTSPNGNVELKFYIADGGRPTYEVNYKGRPVVLPSHLGLELARDKHASLGMEEHDLIDGFKLKDEQQKSFDETWTPVWGETATIRNHYVEYVATLTQEWEEKASPTTIRRERTIAIRFRVYDDGIGLRYEFPQQKDLNYFLIQEERTEFAMTGDHTAWWLPGDYDTQEQETQQTKLSEIRDRMQTAVNWGNSSVATFSETGVQTFMISGNHDSPERLAFGGRLMERSGIHVSPVFAGGVVPVELEDSYGKAGIYMLPFIKPANVGVQTGEA